MTDPSVVRPSGGGAAKGGGLRRQREQERHRREARNRVLRILAVVVAAAAVIVFLVLSAGGDKEAPDSSALGAVKTFEDLDRTHVQEKVDYGQTPPVGGNHAPTWQDCGVYGQPIVTELGVHSMEHGAVWITYRGDLPESDVGKLEELAIGQAYVLLSPWPGELPAPVVASAWGRQLLADSAADPGLTAFIRTFQQGSQTPEPDAPCTGGQAAR